MEESVCMMRIDKYLAEMGQGTRSEIKKLIRSGRVMVDGETVKKPELKIDETTQKVSLEGKQIGYTKKEYYMLYKPAAAVTSARRAGTTATLDVLTKYFSYHQMPVVSSCYWNMVHGNEPAEVMKDEEGMQTMRTLGANMAYLLKCIEAGKAAGVTPPAPGPRLFTNFIR